MKKYLSLVAPLLLLVACAGTPEDDDGDDETTPSGDVTESVGDGEPDDGEVASTSSAATSYKCGTNLVTQCRGGRTPQCVVYVHYRHCTSGSKSIKVKAEISFYPDGRCISVGAHKTALIAAYGAPPGMFKRIKRC